MKKILALIFMVSIVFQLKSQIDTVSIKSEVYSLVDKKQHLDFWNTVHHSDQGFRGKHSNDSIDLVNLVKCSYYLNKFGFPNKDELGSNSQIIKFVWIHNKYPKTDLFTFPIIMEGFKNKQITEEDFREYFIRSIYKRKFADKGYIDLPINELLKNVKPNINRSIDIRKLLEIHNMEYSFLNQKHEQIGIWFAPIQIDTLYLEGKPILTDRTDDPIKIFKSVDGKYYYHKLYADRSHYPQELIKQEKTYKLFKKSNFMLQIMENGNLKVIFEDQNYKEYTTENIR